MILERKHEKGCGVSAKVVKWEVTEGGLTNRSNVQLQRGNHEQAGGEAGRRIQEHSERLWKMDEDQWEDEWVERWRD